MVNALCDDSKTTNMMEKLFAKDPITFYHSQRVGHLSKKFTDWLQLDLATTSNIHVGALLHDIGKLMINDSILKKTGPLTKMEYNLIKEHPNIGGKIVKPCSFPNSIVNIIKFHHERWDGEGYPKGLSKKDIPYEARLVCVVDAFDAMVVNRIYTKEKKTISDALQELLDCANSQFDPSIVDEFVLFVNKSSFEQDFFKWYHNNII
ncbi:HD-GYP domain-containing protein [Filobacillus milosensis]|nr:HD domain-containing phosphohydrolase [Filobacillus milosensis]